MDTWVVSTFLTVVSRSAVCVCEVRQCSALRVWTQGWNCWVTWWSSSTFGVTVKLFQSHQQCRKDSGFSMFLPTLFQSPFWFWISSCLQVLCPFLKQVVCCVVSRTIYIFWILEHYQLHDLQILSMLWVLFTFSVVSFKAWKLLILIKSSYFPLFTCAFGVITAKSKVVKVYLSLFF